MKKQIGLLSVLLGVVGIGMLFLSFTLGLSIARVIGVVMIIVGIVVGLVSIAIEEDSGITLRETSSDDELRMPSMDKGQFPPSGYTPGPR